MNEHQRDRRIKFEPLHHIYYIDGICEGYVSVTKFIHNFFTEFNVEVVIKEMKQSPKWKDSKYFNMSDMEIKQIWEENRNKEAKAGTLLHADIENYYNNKNVSNQSPEWHFFLKFVKNNPNLKAYRTEWAIFNERLKLAGSIDMVFVDEDGAFHIYDWKRTKSIKKTNDFDCGIYPLQHLPNSNYWHYSLQLNIYRRMLKVYGIEIKSMKLIQLHPDWKTYIEHECPVMDSEVERLFAQRLWSVNQK